MKTSLPVLQKIEIIDDEESDMISNSEVEQVNSFLDYKVKAISNCEFIKRRYQIRHTSTVLMYQSVSLPLDKLNMLGSTLTLSDNFDISQGAGHFN